MGGLKRETSGTPPILRVPDSETIPLGAQGTQQVVNMVYVGLTPGSPVMTMVITCLPDVG